MICRYSSLGNLQSKGPGDIPLSGSVQFNGSNHLSSAQNLSFGTGQFCIEMWYLHVANPSGIQCLVGFGPASNGSYAVLFNYGGTGRLSFYLENVANYGGSGTIPTSGAWNHVVVQRRSDSKIQIFLNGTSIYISPSAVTTALNISNGCQIGRQYSNAAGSNLLNGSRITGLRISNVARYSANFTPSINRVNMPSGTLAAYNFSTSGTFLAGEGTSATLTNNGAVAWNSGVPT